jgi:transcriptional regulator with XRE-family HTH domain
LVVGVQPRWQSPEEHIVLDLSALGRELRERRRMLRISSAELARRIGVSPTYIWLIESASPRKNGLPSRPSEDVLRQWTQALGMGAVDTERMRSLAGYFGTTTQADVRPPMPRLARMRPNYALLPSDAEDHGAAMAAPFPSAGPSPTAPMPPAPAPRGDEPAPEEVELGERLRRLLRMAELRGRTEEITDLVRSHLQWLQHRVEDEDM